jgi:hypothetical protein
MSGLLTAKMRGEILTNAQEDGMKKQSIIDSTQSVIVSKSADPATRAESLAIIHSGLFTAASKNSKRKSLEETDVPVLPGSGYRLIYTGIELRVNDDEDVWINIVYYASKQSIHNKNFKIETKTSEFLRTMGWGSAGSDYAKLRSSLNRLKSASLSIIDKDGNLCSLPNFIRNFAVSRKGQLSKTAIVLEPDIYHLYTEALTCEIDFQTRQDLTTFERKVYSLLIGRINELSLENITLLCGVSPNHPRQFKAKLITCLNKLQELNIIEGYKISREGVAFFKYPHGNLKVLSSTDIVSPHQ